MTIHVEPLSATRVLIVRTPSFQARLILGAKPSSEIARWTGTHWTTPIGWVGREAEAAIDDALQAGR